MNRRNFLQTAAFTLVAAYSPISLPRAKPPVPLSSIFTPGIWAGNIEGGTIGITELRGGVNLIWNGSKWRRQCV